MEISLGTGAGGTNGFATRALGRGRTPSSVAVSAEGERWVLVNAPPDRCMQLAGHAPCRRRSLRTAQTVLATLAAKGLVTYDA